MSIVKSLDFAAPVHRMVRRGAPSIREPLHLTSESYAPATIGTIRPYQAFCERFVIASERSHAVVRSFRSKQMSFEHEGHETNRVGNRFQLTRVPGASRKRTPQCSRSCLVIPVIGLEHHGQVIPAICLAAVRSPQTINGIATAYIGRHRVTTMNSIIDEKIRM